MSSHTNGTNTNTNSEAAPSATKQVCEPKAAKDANIQVARRPEFEVYREPLGGGGGGPPGGDLTNDNTSAAPIGPPLWCSSGSWWTDPNMGCGEAKAAGTNASRAGILQLDEHLDAIHCPHCSHDISDFIDYVMDVLAEDDDTVQANVPVKANTPAKGSRAR